MEFSPQPYASKFQPPRAAGAGAPIQVSNQGAVLAAAAPEWKPPQLAKRPKHLLLAQISPDKPGDEASGPAVPYSIMVALILGGISVGLLTHKHRDHAVGGIVFGAAASVVGVGFTLLIVELAK